MIFQLLFPAYEKLSETVNPGVCSFDDPASSFEPWILLALLHFLAARLHVRLVMPSLEKLANVFGVVAFVETNVLFTCGGLRSPDGKIVEGGLKKFDICLLYTSPSPRDATLSRMPSSA